MSDVVKKTVFARLEGQDAEDCLEAFKRTGWSVDKTALIEIFRTYLEHSQPRRVSGVPPEGLRRR